MARSFQVCIIHLIAWWFSLCTSTYPQYSTTNYFSSRYSSPYTQYKPKLYSYCLRIVYGRRRSSFPFPGPFFKTQLGKRVFPDFNDQKAIKKSYGDMFMTLPELKKALGIDGSREIKWRNGVRAPSKFDVARQKTSAAFRNDPYQVNSDVCCSTNEVFFINSTLFDIDNVPRKIAQLPKIGAYQFIRHGFCAFKGMCQGTCVQHYINLPLAVDEPGIGGFPVSFRFFSIPGYCSCRFIGF